MGMNVPQSVPVKLSQAVGTATLAAASGSFKNRVMSAVLSAGATAGTITFLSHTTVADATGVISVPANGSVVLPYNEDGWFTTVAGEALDVTVAGATITGVVNVATA